ncbi:MAG: TAXI family TRAP transporter solute-binding subunit [Pseudomonadota bacterium]
MRIRAILICLLIGLTGCGQSPSELTFALPDSPIDGSVAQSLVDAVNRETRIALSLTDASYSDERAIDALLAGDADLALVSNSMPYQDGVATVIPLYPTVLHIGKTGEADYPTLGDLLRDARVFAGPEGSAARVLLRRILERSGENTPTHEFVGAPGEGIVPDVFVVFAPVSPSIIRQQMRDAPPFTLSSIGPVNSVGAGSAVDAVTLVNPYFRPFVIPAGIYGDLTPEPVLTLAVDKVLLARSDIDASLVYDLIGELLRLRPALAAEQPGLFTGLNADFDVSHSTFVLHEGTQSFLQREAPTVYERYSGVAEVVVTILVALGSASLPACESIACAARIA